jgi:hypothetical protein
VTHTAVLTTQQLGRKTSFFSFFAFSSSLIGPWSWRKDRSLFPWSLFCLLGWLVQMKKKKLTGYCNFLGSPRSPSSSSQAMSLLIKLLADLSFTGLPRLSIIPCPNPWLCGLMEVIITTLSLSLSLSLCNHKRMNMSLCMSICVFDTLNVTVICMQL